MTVISHHPIKPSPETQAKILKFVDMLWNQVGEQVMHMKNDEDLRPAFVFAYENGAQVMWLSSLSEQTKPLVMAGIREAASKVAAAENLVFGALCLPCYVTEIAPGAEQGVRREKVMLHVETPNAEWLMATGTVERHPNGTVALGKREDIWLDEHAGMSVHGEMVGFFPASRSAHTYTLN